MMIFKRACLNIIRMPVRNLLYAVILFSTVITVVLSSEIYQTAVMSKERLEVSYPFIATVTPKGTVLPDGEIIMTEGLPALDILDIALRCDRVKAFDMSMAAGELAEEEILRCLPDDSLLTAPAAPVVSESGIGVLAVQNIMMQRPFMDKSYVLCDGRLFSDEDVLYGNGVILLPQTAAKQYGLSVGDDVVINLPGALCYRRLTVCGIYKSVTGEDVYTAYIPLNTHFADMAFCSPAMALADNPRFETRSDLVNRLDFLLADSDSAAAFMQNAKENGFDFDACHITINDKAYKIANAGISDVIRITLLLLLLAVAAGSVMVIALTFYCRNTRQREAMILHCLGMPKTKIRQMFLCEFCIVFLCAGTLGFLCGMGISDSVISGIRNVYIAGITEKANVTDKTASTMYAQRTTVYQPDIVISFGETTDPDVIQYTEYGTYILPEDEIWVREELFYENFTDNRIRIIGSTDRAGSDDLSYASLSDNYRMGGEEIPCSVGADSGYAVGDTIIVSRISANDVTRLQRSADHTVRYTGSDFLSYAALRVTEVTEETGIHVAAEDLNFLCAYLGVASEKYKCERYDRKADAN